MACELCELMESKDGLIFEDDFVMAAVKSTAVTPGQISVFPKEHITIMEMVPEDVLQHCSILANKVGAAIFESLGAIGTNIMVRNGAGAGQIIPHFSIEIIPRQENDGIDFQWPSKQMMEDEIEILFDKLNEKEVNVKEEKVQEVSEDDDNKKVVSKKGKENYLLKSTKRIP
jgi:diadenosine tetraphosphate (Ap4A) HIT family hydrolase